MKLNIIEHLSIKDLEKILIWRLYEEGKIVDYTEGFFLNENQEFFKKLKWFYVIKEKVEADEVLEDNLVNLINKEGFKIDSLLQIIKRKKYLTGEKVGSKRDGKILLEKTDLNGNKLVLYSNSFIGVVGYNHVGKTLFCVVLAYTLALKGYKVCYITSEDRIIFNQVKQDFLDKVDVWHTLDKNTVISLAYMYDYDVLFVDAIPSIARFSEINPYKAEEFVKNLSKLSSSKTVISVNHLLKKVKVEGEPPSIYRAYLGEWANLLDTGLVITRAGHNRMGVFVEKDRNEDLIGTNLFFDVAKMNEFLGRVRK